MLWIREHWNTIVVVWAAGIVPNLIWYCWVSYILGVQLCKTPLREAITHIALAVFWPILMWVALFCTMEAYYFMRLQRIKALNRGRDLDIQLGHGTLRNLFKD